MTKSTVVVGIDPGLHGAVAVIFPNGQVQLTDIPTYERKSAGGTMRNHFDIPKMVEMIRNLPVDNEIFIERAKVAVGSKGSIAVFSTALGYGLWLGIFEALRNRCHEIEPGVWKRKMVGVDVEKSESLRVARSFFFGGHPQLTLAKHHNRAEAYLIALYGKEMNGCP